MHWEKSYQHLQGTPYYNVWVTGLTHHAIPISGKRPTPLEINLQFDLQSSGKRPTYLVVVSAISISLL
eukprot:3240219-Amphidinium_carterae.1